MTRRRIRKSWSITIMFAFLFVPTLPHQGFPLYYSMTAGTVVIARYIGDGGYYDTASWDTRLNREGPTLCVGRLTFRKVLSVSGPSPAATFEVLFEYDMPGNVRRRWYLDDFRYRENKLLLMCIERVPEDLKVTSRWVIPDLIFQAENRAQFYSAPGGRPLYLNYIELPERTYSVQGRTPLQRWDYILAQAYAQTRDPKYLTLIGGPPPTPPGRRPPQAPIDLSEEPDFNGFYSSTIEPMLMAAAGSNDLLRLQVLGKSIRMGYRVKQDDYRALLRHIDETYPDLPDDFDLFLAQSQISDQAYITSLLSARLPRIRALALWHLEANDVHKSTVIGMLTDDSPIVRKMAIRWLKSRYGDSMPEGQRPPAPEYGPGGPDRGEILNEQEIIRYWQSRG